VTEKSTLAQLTHILRDLGIRTIDDRLVDGKPGFPVCVSLNTGDQLVLDLDSPAFLSGLDPDQIGVALLDPLGYPRKLWGIAKRVGLLKSPQHYMESELTSLVSAAREGDFGAMYHDGFRFFAGPTGHDREVFVLIVNAVEERRARRLAESSRRSEHALKRLGKALTMNQTLQPMCVAATHELCSALELAAGLIWVYNSDEDSLQLAASVGVNRNGNNILASLRSKGGTSCAAELVAESRKQFAVPNVLEHVLTAQLEAKFCYLKPGGLSVHPLVISDRLVGVLELVGRHDDLSFNESSDLFETVAEHFALALNSAMMFENYEQLASRDPLTGLSNHRSMQEFLLQRLSEAERSGQEVGVVMLDVDHFRAFNEEEGHDVGDEVLRLVADALRSTLRPYDLAARYGGEEFTIIMPGSGRTGLTIAAERIRQRVEQSPFMTRTGRQRNVTVSIGGAIYPTTAKDGATLLKAADTALYASKRAGRNRVTLFEGQFCANSQREDSVFDSVLAVLSEEERLAALARVQRLKDELDRIARAIHLSARQTQIVEALMASVDIYKHPTRREVLAAGDFRVLQPSLQSFERRFDEEGEGIPPLARVLAVLLAVDASGGKDLYADPGMFDPEIVAAVTDEQQAAA
jgi:diguanylate cyclase (GGDEF)-like protein